MKLSTENVFPIYFGLSMAKVGNNTIDHYFELAKIPYVWGHEVCVLSISDVKHPFGNRNRRMLNINDNTPEFKSINDLLAFLNLPKPTKIKIIISYREPFARIISHYYFTKKHLKIKNDLIANNNYVITEHVYAEMKKILRFHDYENIVTALYENDMGIDISKYTYNFEKGFTEVNLNENIDLVFTRLEDLPKFGKNFLNLTGNLEGVIINENKYTSKPITFGPNLTRKILKTEHKWLKFYGYI